MSVVIDIETFGAACDHDRDNDPKTCSSVTETDVISGYGPVPAHSPVGEEQAASHVKHAAVSTKSPHIHHSKSSHLTHDVLSSLDYLKNHSIQAVSFIADAATGGAHDDREFDEDVEKGNYATTSHRHINIDEDEESDIESASEHIEEDDAMRSAGTFERFSWCSKSRLWQSTGTHRARSLHSVILPVAAKDHVLCDMNKFMSEDTKSFYSDHSIPYRRGYLFHGVPGSGKTSLIQALAGYYKRGVYFLQPTDPLMTDVVLLDAIRQVAQNCFVVIEDVDGLFDEGKTNRISTQSSLTFGGLTSALDGIGGTGKGEIIIMTTNERGELHHELMRSGRVDTHIAFHHACPEQIAAMFSEFCPQYKDSAEEFVVAVSTALGEKHKIAAADLQHFFVQNMGGEKEVMFANITNLIRDLHEVKHAAKHKQMPPKNKLDYLHSFHMLHLLHLFTFLSVTGYV
jgi:hypothetical protein